MNANNTGDFFGLEFETDYPLLFTEFEDREGIFVVYTSKGCLEIGVAEQLRTTLETHQNTREWLILAGKEELYIAFHEDLDHSSRQDKVKHLKSHLHPLLGE